MCGRYSLTTPAEALATLFGAPAPADLAPRYNIAPTQQVPIVRLDADGARRFAMPRWGLIPSWAKDRDIGARLINARAETVNEKPSFRAAFRKRRCLMPADGFYEWQARGTLRQPFHIARADGQPFAFAGLWESWSDPDGATIESCALITTAANDRLRPIHDRMPVILDQTDYDLWLDVGFGTLEAVQALLGPTAMTLDARPVSRHVNNPRHDDPRCLETAAADQGVSPRP